MLPFLCIRTVRCCATSQIALRSRDKNRPLGIQHRFKPVTTHNSCTPKISLQMDFLRDCVKKDVFKLKLGSYLETPLQKAKVCYVGGVVLEKNGHGENMSEELQLCRRAFSFKSPLFLNSSRRAERGMVLPIASSGRRHFNLHFLRPLRSRGWSSHCISPSPCVHLKKSSRILLKKVKWEALTSIFLDIMCNDPTLLHELWQALAYGRCGKREWGATGI